MCGFETCFRTGTKVHTRIEKKWYFFKWTMSKCRKRLRVLIEKGEIICHCNFLNRNFHLKKGKLSVVETQGMHMCIPKMSVRKQDKKTIWLTCQQRMQAFKLQLGDVLPGTCCLNKQVKILTGDDVAKQTVEESFVSKRHCS